MQLRNTTEQYGLIAKWLHWILAVGIIYALVVGYILLLVPHHSLRHIMVMINQSIGLSVFPLMFIRMCWAALNPRVVLPPGMPNYEKFLARLVQYSIYFFVFALIISGFFMLKESFWYFGLFEIKPWFSGWIAYDFRIIHASCSVILSLLVSVHIAAALKHHFINRDDVLKKML